MGGDLRAVTRDKKVIAFEITFSGQPMNLSPSMRGTEYGAVRRIQGLRITGRDMQLPFVKMHLEDTLAYLQCYFDVASNFD